MNTMIFDTLKVAEQLQEAGMSAAQAKVVSNVLRDSRESSDTVTKADFREYKSEIKGDFQKLDQSLRHEISDLRKEVKADMDKMLLQMTVRLGGMIAAGIAILIALKQF